MRIEGDRENEIEAQKRQRAFLVRREWRKIWNNNQFEASDPMKLDMEYFTESVEARKKQTTASDVQNNLKQEILQLERRLEQQFEVRCALERALGYKPSSSSCVDSNEIMMPEPATKLIKEIAVLELEVAYLEQHLLSLYRKAFDQQLSSSVSPSAKEERLKSSLTNPSAFLEVSKPDNFSKGGCSAARYNAHELEIPANDQYNGNESKEKLLDSSVFRCHSSLSHCSAIPNRTSPAESLVKAVCSYHSRQLSMMEYSETASPSIISLAEQLGTRVSDHIPDTPNRISEEMVKCISAIYCKLAEPTMTYQGIPSPSSSFSSMSAFSLGDQGNTWNSGFRNNPIFDGGLDNPFQVEGLQQVGPYSSMVQVSWIYRESLKLGDTEHLLQNFRSLIYRLEEVDPGKLKHEEKLAFWINIHNALMMNAFLAHGIPQNNMKRVSILLKAAYNVGGQTITADTIQNTILGCRMPRPGQWLRFFLSPWTKLRTGDGRQAYAIEHPEPLLHFALCSGNHSDPAVRVYTAKRALEELEVAKEEYIRATFGIRKDQKIVLPKLVESYAKDSGLSLVGVMEIIRQCLPQSTSSVCKYQISAKSRKNIEWIPHNFAFRYLISKDLVMS